MNAALTDAVRRLRLSGLARTLDVRLQEATGNHLSHADFLELILADELTIRGERLIARRVKAAAFRDLKTLDDFDWRFNPSIPRKTIYDLATCQFIRDRRDVLLIGPPGVGKSHVAQALGYPPYGGPSSSDTPPATPPSSTSSATSSKTKPSPAPTTSSPATSSPTSSSLTTWDSSSSPSTRASTSSRSSSAATK